METFRTTIIATFAANHIVKSKAILAFIFWLLMLPATGQTEYKALTWRSNTAYHSYLMRNLHRLYDKRRAQFDVALSSKENLRQYQEKIRKSYLEILGKLPEKTALNAVVTGKIKKEGFTLEKVIYESAPGHHVTANLYIPQGKGKFPAVLFFCGHEIEGKATKSYQKTARLFAKNGFVVLVIDPISQGERIQLVDAAGKSLTRGATTEHTLLNAGANLLGTSVAAYQLWDNVRGLDYLATRPEVDMSRVGCLGNSGGGNQTAYFMAYDERVKVAALASFFTQRERYVELSGPQDGCQQIPFEGREHLEIVDFATIFAPKPLIVLAGYFDFVDYRGTKTAFNDLEKVYDRLGAPDKASLFTYADGHGISKPKREAAVNWFRRWLYNDNTKIEEGNLRTLNLQQLNCTATGNVNTTFKNEKTIPERELDLYNALEKQRRQFLKNTPEAAFNDTIRALLGIKTISPEVVFEVTGTAATKTYDLVKLSLYRAGEMPVPCLVFHSKVAQASGKTVLFLNENDKETMATNDSLLGAHMSAGNTLILADLRGFGETADDADANHSKYWNREYRNATISLYNGRPVIGQRVVDIFTLLDYMETDDRLQNTSIVVIANGLYQPAVLHAAVLDERIDNLRLTDEIIPYKNYLEDPLQKDMYTNVIPGVLQYYDLPDLMERISDR